VAARPHRVAQALVQRCTDVALSSHGAQGSIDRTAQDRQQWQPTRQPQAGLPVTAAWEAGDGVADRCLEGAMDGGMAHLDGRWHDAQVGPIRVRRLAVQAEAPTLSEHLLACAHLQAPNTPTGAQAWVDQNRGALLTDHVGAVLGALKRMRPWQQAVRTPLAQRIG